MNLRRCEVQHCSPIVWPTRARSRNNQISVCALGVRIVFARRFAVELSIAHDAEEHNHKAEQHADRKLGRRCPMDKRQLTTREAAFLQCEADERDRQAQRERGGQPDHENGQVNGKQHREHWHHQHEAAGLSAARRFAKCFACPSAARKEHLVPPLNGALVARLIWL